MDHDPVLDAVGQRLRSLRQQHQLSLAGLSAMTGISTSTLSRLESGGRKPTLELLLALARAYQVPLDDLVGAPPTGDPRVRLRPFHRHGRTLIPLTQRPSGPRAYKMIVPPTAADDDSDIEQKAHEGYEWMYVLSGRLRLRLAQHDFVMKAGEVAEFDTRVPHWFGSAGPEAAEVLVLFGPQGERMHVRARPKATGLPGLRQCRAGKTSPAQRSQRTGRRALPGQLRPRMGHREALARGGRITVGRIEYLNDPDAPKPNSLVPAAGVLAVDGDGRLLLQQRRDTGQWAIPMGKQELGETVAECAVRETREETGVTVEVTGLLGTYSDLAQCLVLLRQGKRREIIAHTSMVDGRPSRQLAGPFEGLAGQG